MGKIIGFEPTESLPRFGWSVRERAELEQMRLALGPVVPAFDWDEGTTDTGDPWMVAIDTNSDELALHLARIGREYVVLDGKLAPLANSRSLKVAIESCADYCRSGIIALEAVRPSRVLPPATTVQGQGQGLEGTPYTQDAPDQVSGDETRPSEMPADALVRDAAPAERQGAVATGQDTSWGSAQPDAMPADPAREAEAEDAAQPTEASAGASVPEEIPNDPYPVEMLAARGLSTEGAAVAATSFPAPEGAPAAVLNLAELRLTMMAEAMENGADRQTELDLRNEDRDSNVIDFPKSGSDGGPDYIGTGLAEPGASWPADALPGLGTRGDADFSLPSDVFAGFEPGGLSDTPLDDAGGDRFLFVETVEGVDAALTAPMLPIGLAIPAVVWGSGAPPFSAPDPVELLPMGAEPELDALIFA
ncbi:MAG: hypothetical protein AAFX62_06015 [Pseudomonadota bacterium]